MVDQAGIGTNTSYIADFIEFRFNPKLFNIAKIEKMYIKQGLSAAQIADELGVAKSTILRLLDAVGVRLGTKVGRSTNPENYRNCSPPYGYKVRDGKLVMDKAELKICRLVVALRDRRGMSTIQVAKELERRGLQNRAGRTVWNTTTVLNIFERWNGKV